MDKPHLNDTLNRDFCTFLLVVVMMIKDTTHGPTFFLFFQKKKKKKTYSSDYTERERKSNGRFAFSPFGVYSTHSTFNNSNKIEGFQVKWRCFLKWRFFGGRSRKTTRQRHTHTQAGQRPILLRVCVCVCAKEQKKPERSWLYVYLVISLNVSRCCCWCWWKCIVQC